MPNFHALAVFEACGSSTEEIQESVSSLFASFSHQRVRYHEHELSAGPSAESAGKSFYCMVFVDCDVDAYTEEKALDFANDAFEYISKEAANIWPSGSFPVVNVCSAAGKNRGRPTQTNGADGGVERRAGVGGDETIRNATEGRDRKRIRPRYPKEKSRQHLLPNRAKRLPPQSERYRR